MSEAGSDPLHVLLDASPEAVVEVDAGGRVRYVNDRAVDLFGWHRPDVVGGPVEVFLPPGPASRHQAHVHSFLDSPVARGMGSELSLSARRHDGSEFPVEISLTPVLDGTTVRVFATVTDVTARRAAERHTDVLGRAYLTLARTSRAVIRATDPVDLFAQVCRVAVDQGGYVGAWVAVPGEGDHRGLAVTVASAGTITSLVGSVDVSLDPGGRTSVLPTARALREGDPVYVDDILTSRDLAPWRSLAQERGIRAMAALPLRRGGKVVAALVLYDAQPDTLEDEVRLLLERVADSVSFGLEAFARRDRLRLVAVQRARLLDQLVDAHEVERVRFAEEIHDDPVQVLAAADVRLGLLEQQLSRQAPDLVGSLESVHATLAHTLRGLRDLLFDLEPGLLDDGLVAAVREAAGHVLARGRLSWEVRGELAVEPSRLSSTQALRIVKEALVNVVKHAGASTVGITLTGRDDGVEIEVVDDGVGIDAGQSRRPGHRGLQTMQDRAEGRGGWCQVESVPSGGTRVRLWVPGQAADPAGP